MILKWKQTQTDTFTPMVTVSLIIIDKNWKHYQQKMNKQNYSVIKRKYVLDEPWKHHDKVKLVRRKKGQMLYDSAHIKNLE